ncbi:zf-HC2 domain-containing protein [Streptomyces glaucosporus]|uniref:Zf-HC2 domain-containing protein n=1 Tax=Streptomyces glaucosporus TaxID=284044 RepID=A0ABP5VIR8_9ACTN
MSGTYDAYDAYDTDPTPVEQHLGDRLAALVDGELEHETRERVLAHLATCRSCKAEADAQRRLKSVFADSAPPPPPEGLLARLQGLPAGLDDEPGPDGPAGPSGSPWDFGYLSPGGVLSSGRGFRIHETDRSASRGRRFAFAAAGAVSLAAFAIGGALTSGAPGGSAPTAAGDGGTAAGAPRTAATAGAVRGGERSGAAEREEVGTFGGPAATPTPSPSAPQPEADRAVRQYGLMTVPVLDATPTLHPPLIRPTYFAAQPLETGSEARPFPGASPSAAVSGPAVVPGTDPVSATPSATPGR